MQLKQILESRFTSSMESLVLQAVKELQRLLKTSNYEFGEEQELISGLIIDEKGNQHEIYINVEFVDDEDEHLEAMAFGDGSDKYIVLSYDPEIKTPKDVITRIIGHELIHHIDVGPFSPVIKPGEKMDKYWEHPSEVNAEISSFVHFTIQKLKRKHSIDEIKVAITQPGFVDKLLDSQIDQWKKMFGFKHSHLFHYQNNPRLKKKIFKQFAKLLA